ncbi:hypothetical protein B0O99DRAFT_510003 [Bisporella sp. PMI_857]|nr:hypothetical protein B0O99DRAFT_510003 [Bisporella sp. PMI_857]
MPPTAVDREDYSQLEKIYRDLIFSPDGSTPEKRKGLKHASTILNSDPDPKEQELCWSCGWTVYDEVLASYGSRIRIVHTRANMGTWEVGSRWMICDRSNDATLWNDFITQEFLRNQPSLTIPLIKEMRKLSAPMDKVDLTLMSRAPGITLDRIWHTLTPGQKSNYRNQVGDVIKQMRQFTSPVPRKVDGKLPKTLSPLQIFTEFSKLIPSLTGIGILDDIFENLKEELCFGLSEIHETEDPLIIEEKYQELKRNFPKSDPYVLTHEDLNLSNIIVKDNKIEATIDWEWTGYFPWWAERWLSNIV